MSNTDSIHTQVRVGHAHLKVTNLDRAIAFYRDALGFQVTQQMGQSAAFLGAGGYHLHVGLNVWESKGGAPAPPGTTGLYHRRTSADEGCNEMRQSWDGAEPTTVAEGCFRRKHDR